MDDFLNGGSNGANVDGQLGGDNTGGTGTGTGGDNGTGGNDFGTGNQENGGGNIGTNTGNDTTGNGDNGTDGNTGGFDFSALDLNERVVKPEDFSELAEAGIDVEDTAFLDEVNDLAEMGLSPAQITSLYNKYNVGQAQNNEPTPDEIRANLVANLSKEQKRDYSAVGRMMSEHITDTKLLNQFMGNDVLVGIAHSLYKSLVVGGNQASDMSAPAPAKSGLSHEEAISAYQSYVQENTSGGRRVDWKALNDLKQDLANRCSDPERFLTIVG